MFRNPTIKISNYLSNQFYTQEILIIFSAILIAYSTVDIGVNSFLISSMFIAFYILLSYGLIKAYFYGKNIESGVFGYLFTSPVRRGTTLFITYTMDCLIIPSSIIVEILLLFYLKFFYIPVEEIIVFWFAAVSVMSFFLAVGRIIGVFARDAIVSMAVLFGVYEVMELSASESDKAYIHFIHFLNLNFYLTSLSSIIIDSFILLIVSTIIIIISSRKLLNSGLKSGR